MPKMKEHLKYSRTFFRIPCQKCQRKLARGDVRLKETTFNQWYFSPQIELFIISILIK